MNLNEPNLNNTMTRKPHTINRVFIGRLPSGVDLVGAITKIANEEEITVGTVAVHGLVQRAVLTIQNQESKLSERVERDGGLEIAAMSGTISQFKGRSLARLNGVLATRDGALIGGTVALGTLVHACEVVITELHGATLSRDFDMETGLPLWKAASLLLSPSE